MSLGVRFRERLLRVAVGKNHDPKVMQAFSYAGINPYVYHIYAAQIYATGDLDFLGVSRVPSPE